MLFRIPARLILLSVFLSTGPLAAGADDLNPSSGRNRAKAEADLRPHAGMLRFPDVGSSQIVFVYANDLWLVSRKGGVATPLAGPPGQELFPRFSQDNATIAFVGNYEGDRDLYTISTGGGIAFRVTYHPANETLCDWTPDGRLMYSTNGFAGLRRQTQLYTAPPDGGLPSKLPVPYGANGAISPDGKWLAYTPHSRDFRTWKRYRGGMATDIWLFNLESRQSRKITDWEGTDTQPMWHGKTVYYLSDAGPSHRLNIWSFDTEAGTRRQITDFKDFDVKWPSVGPGPDGRGEIVFQNGSALYLLDLATRRSTPVEIQIPGDRPKIRRRAADASKLIANWNVSSTGKRAVFEARGDIWTVPAKEGSPRNLTRTSGVAERDPAWSPDGRWIAYLSDASGEYELYIRQSDGKGEARQLTQDGAVFRYNPTWSPDSKHIAFADMSGALFVLTVETAATSQVDTDPWGNVPNPRWSHDSRWIAYTKNGDNRNSAVWLFELESGERHQVTSGVFNDSWPTFDRDGDFLYFASNRDFSSPMYEDVGTTFIYADTDILITVPLRDDVASPLAPKSDEEKWGDEKEENGDDEENGEDKKDDDENGESKDEASGDEKDDDDEKDKKKKEIEPLEIDIDGFESRAVQLPMSKGSFYNLAVNDKGHLIYVRGPARGSDQKPSIRIYDPEAEKEEDKEEKTVLEKSGAFAITSDGEKLLVGKDGGGYAIVDAAAEQKADETVPLGGMTTYIEPREEWRQIFNEAWRIPRDFFYVSNMHGVDWPAMRDHYALMLDDCVSRADVTYVIGEMISELNVGHAYVRGAGDVEHEPRVSTGMLGCDFELREGAYRIVRIYQGAPWDLDARGPLSQPGTDVKEGDYLLAVNGVPLDTTRDPWAAFQGLANSVITLTVSDEPVTGEAARDVVVKTTGSESTFRYRAWIEKNRTHVEQRTDGRVGYIYVPNTGRQGQNELVRQFFGQIDKAALIIDERWNGGGQIPTRFIELLNRPITNYWARRHGKDWPWPPDAHQGPKCMLING
ncbi:MAG: PDZ domain-containing protein, partial [Planctomycetota bacterium]|nr:PDZ domain-containing protein [Planctomycetota bacterium]